MLCRLMLVKDWTSMLGPRQTPCPIRQCSPTLTPDLMMAPCAKMACRNDLTPAIEHDSNKRLEARIHRQSPHCPRHTSCRWSHPHLRHGMSASDEIPSVHTDCAVSSNNAVGNLGLRSDVCADASAPTNNDILNQGTAPALIRVRSGKPTFVQ